MACDTGSCSGPVPSHRPLGSFPFKVALRSNQVAGETPAAPFRPHIGAGINRAEITEPLDNRMGDPTRMEAAMAASRLRAFCRCIEPVVPCNRFEWVVIWPAFSQERPLAHSSLASRPPARWNLMW